MNICKICKKALKDLPIKPSSSNVHLHTEHLRKITKRHYNDWRMYNRHLKSILRYPDYVGYRPTHRSIQLVKKVNGVFILVAVNITRKAKKLSIRSFHRIPERTLKSRIQNKELRNV